MSDKSNLVKAKKVKNDEFYTRLEDIELELNNYKDYFKDKVIYLPCDGPNSNFVKYFKEHQIELQFKQLIATSYNPNGRGTCVCIGLKTAQFELIGDGDFRSDEVSPIWNGADIIITNPPYSLFRDFFDICKEKKFLIIGSILTPSYVSVFPYFRDNKIWLDRELTKFITPDGNIKLVASGWLTNIGEYPDREFIPLTKSIKDTKYETFDYYPNIINIDRLSDIPYDYDGLMGVPVTLARKYNPKQFELVGYLDHGEICRVNNKRKFARYVIRRIKDE